MLNHTVTAFYHEIPGLVVKGEQRVLFLVSMVVLW